MVQVAERALVVAARVAVQVLARGVVQEAAPGPAPVAEVLEAEVAVPAVVPVAGAGPAEALAAPAAAVVQVGVQEEAAVRGRAGWRRLLPVTRSSPSW